MLMNTCLRGGVRPLANGLRSAALIGVLVVALFPTRYPFVWEDISYVIGERDGHNGIVGIVGGLGSPAIVTFVGIPSNQNSNKIRSRGCIGSERRATQLKSTNDCEGNKILIQILFRECESRYNAREQVQITFICQRRRIRIECKKYLKITA